MLADNLKFILFCVGLIFIQFVINNFTIFYVDLLEIVLIMLLLNGNGIWTEIIIISFVADLIGHWYLGTHLLAIVIISFFTSQVNNFYRICSWLPRFLIGSFYLLFLYVEISVIEITTNRIFISMANLIFQLLVSLPIIQTIMTKMARTSSRKFEEYYLE